MKIIKRFQTWNDKNIDIAILPWLFVGVLLLMTITTQGKFLRIHNVSNILLQMPELGLLSLAMMLAMISGGINLSIISSANLTAVVMAVFLTLPGIKAGTVPAFVFIGVALLLGILVSILLGAVNGYLIGYIEVPAVLATMGTMILYEGITLVITQGSVISDLAEPFLFIGTARFFGIPFPMIIFCVVVLCVSVLLQRRPYGSYLYFIGSNVIATRFSGINTRRVLLQTYILSGLLSGAAAIVMVSRFNSANARQGSSLLLSTVLICMLGGVDPFGGFGKVSGLIMALAILQMLTSGLNLLGIPSFATVAIWGAMLIAVMIYRYIQNKRLEGRLLGTNP